MSAIFSETKTSVKLIGANGQISLGKEYAGRQVLVEEREPGVWFVRTAIVIPENERWLHEPRVAAQLQSALTHAAKTQAKATPLNTLFAEKANGKQAAKSDPSSPSTSKARSQQPGVSKKSA